MFGADAVSVFDAHGTSMPPLPLKDLGLTTSTAEAAINCETDNLLVLADRGSSNQLIGYDLLARSVKWAQSIGVGCYGIASLANFGVFVHSAKDQLCVRRFTDGQSVASARCASPMFIAAFERTLFVDSAATVRAFRWNGQSHGTLSLSDHVREDEDLGVLAEDGHVEILHDTGSRSAGHPLAVMPPSSSSHGSFLIVGTRYSSELVVLALPERRLVHKQTLEGMTIMGLAADPCGAALVICDGSSKSVHVLPWPLSSFSQ